MNSENETTEAIPTPKAPTAMQTRVPIGHVLSTLRNRMAYSVENAAKALDLTERHLKHIESGIRTPDRALIERIAELYGVDPDRIGGRGVMPRVAADLDKDKNVLWLGWLPVELDAVESNETLIESISRNIRSMRCLGDHQPIYIRATDVNLLAALIDLQDPDLTLTFMRHLKLTMTEAAALTETLGDAVSETRELTTPV